jgi:hypothetical protein
MNWKSTELSLNGHIKGKGETDYRFNEVSLQLKSICRLKRLLLFFLKQSFCEKNVSCKKLIIFRLDLKSFQERTKIDKCLFFRCLCLSQTNVECKENKLQPKEKENHEITKITNRPKSRKKSFVVKCFCSCIAHSWF